MVIGGAAGASCVAGATGAGKLGATGIAAGGTVAARGSLAAAAVTTVTSTGAVPLRSMSSLAAAEYERSMIRSPTKGPRSFTRTTIARPLSRFSTRT
jgi:hypothetical protein